MSNQKLRGTITLKKTIIDETVKPEVQVIESCQQAQFKCQCHAFKTVMNEHKIMPSALADWMLQKGRHAVTDIREGISEAKAADVYGLVEFIRVRFGQVNANKAKAIFDEWLPKDLMSRAEKNQRRWS